MSTNQRCSGIYHSVATLVEWLGLVWATVPGFTEVAGQLGCLDCVLISTFKVDVEHRLCQSTSPTQRVPATLSSRDGVLELLSYELVVLLNHSLCVCMCVCPRTEESLLDPSVLSLPMAVCSVRTGVSFCSLVSVSLVAFCHSNFCCTQVVQLPFSSSRGITPQM